MVKLAIDSIKKKLTKVLTQKSFVALIIFAGCLLFYAIGIVTNFFAQPMFEMFFIISDETAHNLVFYIATGAAFAIGTLALVMKLKNKTGSAKMAAIPTILPVPVQTPVKATSTNYPAKYPILEETAPKAKKTPEIAVKIAEKPMVEKIKDPITQETHKQENPLTTNKDKLTCHSCNKEFTTPMLMLDYSDKTVKLATYCPYCCEPLYTQPTQAQNNDFWKRSV